ncbi:hypothetical protein [Propionivibrio sp.]|uniref:hypothetical protein n=1 Tax=Propionivibrio sp. TaxID=2212460 RepID=UPI00262DB32C|nr:hypothetical protein [Propionivibrio sp.]
MKTAARICLAALFGAAIMPVAPTVAQVLGDAASSLGAMAQEQAQIQARAGQVQAQAQAQLQTQAQMQAQSAAPVLPAMPVMPAAAPTQTATTPKSAAAPSEAIVLAGTGVTSPPALHEPEDDEAATIKVPKSVNNVLKKLDKATDNVTLEDINSARDAIAKLDVLLDIEKRLSDLATIRHEREEKSMAAALPASALGMVPSSPVSAAMPGSSGSGGGGAVMTAPPPVSSFSSDPEVLRIVGADGRFVASIKEVDGKTLRVREGDKLMDGSVVESISSNGLTIERDKNKRTIRVKDVGTVLGGR